MTETQRYERFSGCDAHSRITMLAHRIEKGLAFADRYPDFAEAVSRELVTLLEERPDANAHAALREYAECKTRLGRPVPWVREYLAKVNVFGNGGSTCISPPVPDAAFAAALTSRRSVREFSPAVVPDAVIESAVKIAQTAPSVCNRQSGRVHVFSRETMHPLLALQNGNAGFRNISHLFVITSDVRTFHGWHEARQPQIDGGLFAMMFCLGLHSQGVATCFLNWCVDAARDQELRRRCPAIPEHEAVITMLAAGLPANARVTARSLRPFAEVCSFH